MSLRCLLLSSPRRFKTFRLQKLGEFWMFCGFGLKFWNVQVVEKGSGVSQVYWRDTVVFHAFSWVFLPNWRLLSMPPWLLLEFLWMSCCLRWPPSELCWQEWSEFLMSHMSSEVSQVRYGKRNCGESEVTRMPLATVNTLDTSAALKVMMRAKLKRMVVLVAKAWRGLEGWYT